MVSESIRSVAVVRLLRPATTFSLLLSTLRMHSLSLAFPLRISSTPGAEGSPSRIRLQAGLRKSQSKSSTFRPFLARARARFTATVDVPSFSSRLVTRTVFSFRCSRRSTRPASLLTASLYRNPVSGLVIKMLFGGFFNHSFSVLYLRSWRSSPSTWQRSLRSASSLLRIRSERQEVQASRRHTAAAVISAARSTVEDARSGLLGAAGTRGCCSTSSTVLPKT